MGLKFEKNHKEKKEVASPTKEDEENLSMQVSTEDQQKNQSFALFIKNNIKRILIAVLGILILIVIISLVGEQLKSYLKDKLNEYKDISFVGFSLLTLLGTIMVITGAPILFFELSLGCVLNDYIFAVLIATFSKLIGIFISYTITKKFLKNYILNKFGDNLYLKILRKMSKDQPAKAIAMLAIIQIPMLIKNYSLPLFEVNVKYIIIVFCSIQIIQSSLFCFIGSTLTPAQPGNVDSESSVAKDALTYISYIITIIAFYLIYRETQKIKTQYESSLNDDDFDPGSNLKNIEMQQKISYLTTQELQKTHQIKLVYPKINQDD